MSQPTASPEATIAPEVERLKDVRCRKNPRHANFLPLSEVTENTLPRGFQKNSIAKMIRLKGQETVRLTVNYTSHDRPPNLGFAQLKGTSEKRMGCGTVFVTKMDRNQRCPNRNCTIRPSWPHQTTGVFKIMTVAHVVFDDDEAKKTKIEFFLDDERHTDNVIEARGLRVSSVDVANNQSIVECVSHDLNLYKKLQDFRSQKQSVLDELEVSSSPPSSSVPPSVTPTPELAPGEINIKDLLVVFTSHPHGKSKHVSFGVLNEVKRIASQHSNIEVNDTSLVICTLSYTAPTCVGCGGGSVAVYDPLGFCVGFAPHFGVTENRSNASGAGWIQAKYFLEPS